MKIILSRKGFDSEAGGYASPIMPNGELQSMPIPSLNSNTTYDSVTSRYKNMSLCDIMRQLYPAVKRDGERVRITKRMTCHLDPDLDKNAVPRDYGWRGGFGQINAAETVLENEGVESGDLFLFFGWFKHCYEDEFGELYLEKGNGQHVLFGYLQIDRRIHTAKDKVPSYLINHPHAEYAVPGNNAIYLARKKCTWNEQTPGYGLFKYDEELVLTKKGMSRSRWDLPACFKNASISYHNKSSWKNGYFQSVCRGQEFVIQDNPEVADWAINLIDKHRR